MRVLPLLLKGLTIGEAAKELNLSPHTVKTHVKRIYRLHNVHSQLELVLKAKEPCRTEEYWMKMREYAP